MIHCTLGLWCDLSYTRPLWSRWWSTALLVCDVICPTQGHCDHSDDPLYSWSVMWSVPHKAIVITVMIHCTLGLWCDLSHTRPLWSQWWSTVLLVCDFNCLWHKAIHIMVIILTTPGVWFELLQTKSRCWKTQTMMRKGTDQQQCDVQTSLQRTSCWRLKRNFSSSLLWSPVCWPCHCLILTLNIAHGCQSSASELNSPFFLFKPLLFSEKEFHYFPPFPPLIFMTSLQLSVSAVAWSETLA